MARRCATPQVWAGYLDEAIELFGERADVLFAQHHWPRWGHERIVDFLAKQRDLYGYIHDQTLRLVNHGLVGAEIAEELELPPTLEREWHCRGYYGSLNHNAKAVYQRYLGWFDGNPAHLWPHPPQAAAERYVALAGGADALLAKRARRVRGGRSPLGRRGGQPPRVRRPRQRATRASCRRTRWSSSRSGRERHLAQLLPDGRAELRDGVAGTAATVSADVIRQLSGAQLFDLLSIQLDGPRAAGLSLRIRWRFTDTGEEHLVTLQNAVLTHRALAGCRGPRRDRRRRARRRGRAAARREHGGAADGLRAAAHRR